MTTSSISPASDFSGLAWWRGAIIPADQAALPLLTHALHYATCCIEGIRAEPCADGWSVLQLTGHLERLERNARILGLRPPSAADMRAAVEELCGKLCGRLLGYKFRHFARRNFGGKMIDKTSSAHGKNRWVVVAASTKVSAHHPHHRNHPTPEPPVNSCDGGDGGHVSAKSGLTEELPVVAPKGQGRLFGNYEDQMLPD